MTTVANNGQSVASYSSLTQIVNYKTNSIDIINNKYTYVSFASYSNFTAMSNTSYSGFITLNVNYSGDNSYWIFPSFEIYSIGDVTNVPSSEPCNIVVTNLLYNTTLGKWQFKWWFENSGATVTGTLQFVIFYFTPQFTSTNYNNEFATSTVPNAINGLGHLSSYTSNSFLGNTSYTDFVNFFPIISYITLHQDIITTGTQYGTINIQDYSNRYIVLTSIESSEEPTFNTRNLSGITIYNKKSNKFSYSYNISSSGNFTIIFIIFYNNTY